MASSPAASVLGGLGMQVMMSAVSTQKTPSSLQLARFEGTVFFQSAWPVADLQVRSSVASEEPPLSDSSWPLVVVYLLEGMGDDLIVAVKEDAAQDTSRVPLYQDNSFPTYYTCDLGISEHSNILLKRSGNTIEPPSLHGSSYLEISAVRVTSQKDMRHQVKLDMCRTHADCSAHPVQLRMLYKQDDDDGTLKLLEKMQRILQPTRDALRPYPILAALPFRSL
ncbi:hypothetical protein B0J15DRAFT_472894 [Fusarium solani]|uniref:Uncharacterized protein n=1 Tax=Fusarium solani TaxID=169388 RepID=A0A9P9G3M5_FUSSL|nr:uncharacterized protein B0J15DRAFT_472894 [Fusarium solani]KAH7230784.1 hypothetical protein B0J15DRAFT_472894 [Fusarium solani]